MTDKPKQEEKKPEVIAAPHEDSKTSTQRTQERVAAEAEAKRVSDAEAAKVAAAAAVEKAKELEGDLPKPTPEEEVADKAEAGSEEERDGEEPAELDTETFGDTGNAVGNSVLQLIQNAGGTPDQARALLFDAVQSNDLSKIDTAALTELVGEAQATIILAGAKTYAQDVADQSAAIAKEVNSAVGSAENWAVIQTWVDTSSISDSEKGEYNELIAAGGAKARFAASELLSKYNADTANTEITDTSRVDADVDTTTPSEATTAKQYYAAMVEANRKGLDTTAIKAARARGRKAGI